MPRALLILIYVALLTSDAQAQAQVAKRPRKSAEEIARSKARIAASGGGSRVEFPGAPKGMADSPEPGFLIVSAQARIDHRQFPRDTLHYWRLDVLREVIAPGPKLAHEVLWKRDYDRAEFPVKGGVVTTKDFHERLQMPAGRYLVRVWLLDVRWDLDEDGLPALVSTNADGSDNAIMSSYLATVK